MDENAFNVVIDEKPNTYIGIRKVRWSPNAEYKTDIRRYVVKPDGSEIPTKGISFPSEDTVDEIVNNLVELGYGDTNTLLEFLSTRDDIASDSDEKPTSAKDMLDSLLYSNDGR